MNFEANILIILRSTKSKHKNGAQFKNHFEVESSNNSCVADTSKMSVLYFCRVKVCRYANQNHSDWHPKRHMNCLMSEKHVGKTCRKINISGRKNIKR